MKNLVIILLTLSIAYFTSCQRTHSYVIKGIKNRSGKLVADSVIIDGMLKKITFIDSFYLIDSVVYSYYDGSKIVKAKNTYNHGKVVFENKEFYKNGIIKSYLFLDDNGDSSLFERDYDTTGNVVKTSESVSFQGYVTNIDAKTLKSYSDSEISIRIFYPNPPDCSTTLYALFAKGQKVIFDTSKRLGFFCSTTVDTRGKPDKLWHELDIWLELQDGKSGKVIAYNKPLYYQLVNKIQ